MPIYENTLLGNSISNAEGLISAGDGFVWMGDTVIYQGLVRIASSHSDVVVDKQPRQVLRPPVLSTTGCYKCYNENTKNHRNKTTGTAGQKVENRDGGG